MEPPVADARPVTTTHHGRDRVDEYEWLRIGVWAPVVSRLAAGPLVSIGLAYDFSRAGGVYAAGGFATAFGEARIALRRTGDGS